MNAVQLEDCQKIEKLDFLQWEPFRNKTILITGATGLIGSNLADALAYINRDRKLRARILLPVRNVERGKEMFSPADAEILPYESGAGIDLDTQVDYIVHLASPTSSRFFVERPVDTLLANIEGTGAMLEWAREHPVTKFVYLSTMEVYGFPREGHRVKENELGAFETMNARNSYPIAKIACEALCNSYFRQYGVPAVVLRATQTFGPGVKYDDGRVFAQFMRCAVEKRDIVLRSEGLTERPYLYTADAVSAIVTALLRGVPGESYTVANPDTYISIKEMARLVAEEVAGGEIRVVFDLAEDLGKLGYADTLHMDLDVSKLMELGWRPTVGLKEMYDRMMRGIG